MVPLKRVAVVFKI